MLMIEALFELITYTIVVIFIATVYLTIFALPIILAFRALRYLGVL